MAEKKPSLSEYAARKIRGHLGEERISVAALARKLGWSQSYLARRVDGRVAFDLDDLEKVAEEIGVQVTDLLPTKDIANTLRNCAPTKRPRSKAVSSSRPARAASRPPARPTGATPRADTRRPAMMPRTVPA